MEGYIGLDWDGLYSPDVLRETFGVSFWSTRWIVSFLSGLVEEIGFSCAGWYNGINFLATGWMGQTDLMGRGWDGGTGVTESRIGGATIGS